MANYRRLARRLAKRHRINPDYFERQIDAESGFNPNAGSPKGARGIAQIMPGTARAWGVNPENPRQSLNAAAKNMARYLRSYKGDWSKALAAYNAGPGAVQKYGGVPPYAETKSYIRKILRGGSPKDPGGGGGSRAVGGSPGRARVGTTPGELPSGTGVADLLRALRSEEVKQPQQSAPLAAPEFSAKAALPTGYQQVESSGGPAPEQKSLSELLREVSGISGGTVDQSKVTVSPGSDPVGGGAAPISAGPGKLVGAPLDRPGAKTNPKVIDLVRRASAYGNIPIKLGTGTAHNRLTVNGNVSDHWGGNALDLPARGKTGTRIAASLLVQLGVSRKRAAKMARQGGLFNVNYKGRRYQVIWNTQQGGDHTDHVHIGRR